MQSELLGVFHTLLLIEEIKGTLLGLQVYSPFSSFVLTIPQGPLPSPATRSLARRLVATLERASPLDPRSHA